MIPKTILALPLLLALAPRPVGAEGAFRTADDCMACHNGLSTPSGADYSFGYDWRPSMMANAARDPYWQAGVRREVSDHPAARAAIEAECSRCHMPMANEEARAAGGKGEVFANLVIGAIGRAATLAQDGASCSACHRIEKEKLGTKESFTGGFVVARGASAIYGPFKVDAGRTRIMRSATDLTPTEAKHLGESELCATCHTLYTHSLGPNGETIATLPEQVPYLEWQASAYRGSRSCQSCHMPAVPGKVAISSVLGVPREGVSGHDFRGGNFLVPRILARAREAQGVAALPQELAAASTRAVEHLQGQTARLAIPRAALRGGELLAEVAIANLAGHKLPTAYPSRRAWLRFAVRDAGGRLLFESGSLDERGSIKGNDNDNDPRRFEPHHLEITRPDQVQIYEAILGDARGGVTTGLLTGVRYLKDNRLLPRGLDKARAQPDIAVRGAAASDPDFVAGGDRVRYRVRLPGSAATPLSLEVALYYQPIGYRWASTLAGYRSTETGRFVDYYKAMRGATAVRVAGAAVTLRAPASQPAE
jgi:hypothetical protein